VIAVGFTCVDLSEAGHLVAEMAREDDASVACYFFLKGMSWKVPHAIRYAQRGMPASRSTRQSSAGVRATFTLKLGP
jgi:hypothetical protein